MVYGFPGDVCISVNDEVVHGIPGERVLQPGDLVKLDLTAEKDGYHTDSGVSVERLPERAFGATRQFMRLALDRKSTRLNSSHTVISYAVFCLKKKKNKTKIKENNTLVYK